MKKIILLAAALLLSAQANAATVNLDSRTSTATSLWLSAGNYTVTPIKDDYTAWNAWGKTTDCNGMGMECAKGWINNYSITTPTETIFTSNAVKYRDAALALTYALSTSFTLAIAGSVDFFIGDIQYKDNIGGMSLNVSKVPVPAAAFLFAPALLGFLGLRRKAKNLVA